MGISDICDSREGSEHDESAFVSRGLCAIMMVNNDDSAAYRVHISFSGQ
jgi:hypothetical protein